ncbi:MAG: tRNA (adenosine(37)-N6)-threonylcarbamoyltransferase complex dimerization subunit type 1 TsaB [Coleofasciculaceae cyanobacterium SM2_1_6]|nr:tRNA (adenosine(37)-N6)-threonylcarbamoyltransferase complex dimerization subunit type 1 TsaB [Coleofasciculaceae cyanobacterium SM2_1_6]
MTNKYGLALHTTSPQLGLVLDNFQGEARSQTWDLGQEMGNQLHLKLMEIMENCTWQDLSFLAVAIGPGSFTGTRLGVVTARTLAQQLDLPLIGISSFAAFAWWWVYEHPLEFGQILALHTPAQRDQLFVGIYQLTADPKNPLKTLLPDMVMTPPEWQEKLQGLELGNELGDLASTLPVISLEVSQNLGMTAPSLLDLAYHQQRFSKGEATLTGRDFPWSLVLPFYGQHPVA